MYDLCVIGGGAAGISCAISAGRLGLKVLLVEKNNKLGKKLYATGNGKCNLTNTNFDSAKHYNSNNSQYVAFLDTALHKSYNHQRPTKQLIDFMDSIGISTVCDNNYIYPSSAQASSVVWAMIDELKAYNIDICLNTEIISIEGKYPSYEIKSKNEAFKASQIVLACGGAAYKSLGGTYLGYKLAKSTGHNITDIMPCLCGFKVADDLQDLAGVRANSSISLFNKHKFISKSTGELQITNQGLSGICIFELSSKAGKILNSGQKPKLKVSLLDETIYEQLKYRINTKSFGERTVIGLLNGYINDKLATYTCKLNNIDGKTKAKDISKEKLLMLADTLINLEFNITDLYDLEQAQLTAGGVDISQINPETMESTIVEGMYIVGELLDIDGICGGYNLTFAMLSGYKAGKSVYDKNKSN